VVVQKRTGEVIEEYELKEKVNKLGSKE